MSMILWSLGVIKDCSSILGSLWRFITKYDSCFVRNFLLEDVTALLQKATAITKFDIYYKMCRYIHRWVVWNRATQDTSQKSQGNFFFVISIYPFFIFFKTWKIINWDFWEVSWVALFHTTIIFAIFK